MPGGVPSAGGAAGSLSSSAPAAPDVSSFGSAGSPGDVAGKFSVDAATSATGVGDVTGRADSARGTVEGAQATVADPTGAAMSTANSRVSGAMSEQAPVDPAAAKAKADFASSAIDNPEGAAADQASFGVDTQTSDTGASVQIKGGVTPSLDPKK
jgi:hypothetical protein